MSPKEADFDLAHKVITRVANSMEGYNKEVKDLVYRNDYADYMVLMSDNTFAPIREKIIESFDDDPKGDLQRELEGLLRNAEVADEFNQWFDLEEELGDKVEDDGEIAIDDETPDLT